MNVFFWRRFRYFNGESCVQVFQRSDEQVRERKTSQKSEQIPIVVVGIVDVVRFRLLNVGFGIDAIWELFWNILKYFEIFVLLFTELVSCLKNSHISLQISCVSNAQLNLQINKSQINLNIDEQTFAVVFILFNFAFFVFTWSWQIRFILFSDVDRNQNLFLLSPIRLSGMDVFVDQNSTEV